MKEAILFEELENKKTKCKVCQHYCIIPEGKRGFCQTRLNRGGIIYTLIYGQVASLHADPIEKKPLYHFYPGSVCLSLGSLGCNFKCSGCQNWEISCANIDEKASGTRYITASESIDLAIKNNCQGISWTYNEPAIWLEYTLDSAKKAQEKGLYTAYVTNGYISVEGLDLIGPYLDAYRVDIKGFAKETYKKIAGITKFEGITEVTKRAKEKWSMHIECVTNLTTGINDDLNELKNLAHWIANELGKDTPWHITRFYPNSDLSLIPATPISSLEKTREIGLKEGLKYVYLGNIMNHPAEHTYCPNCKKVVIKRNGYSITEFKLTQGKCSFCQASISGRYEK